MAQQRKIHRIGAAGMIWSQAWHEKAKRYELCNRQFLTIALEARTGECRLSVAELVAEMTALATLPEALSTDEFAELDCRWTAIEAEEATISNHAVVR
jgi:hypothetical protein